MATIAELRAAFDKMDTAMKSQFINDLDKKLKNRQNPEYTAFLNECIKKYDAESRGGSSKLDSVSASKTNNISGKKLYPETNKIAEWLKKLAFLVAGICTLCGVVFSNVSTIELSSFTDFERTMVSLTIFFAWTTAGLVSGLLHFAFAEIVQILHDIRNNTVEK